MAQYGLPASDVANTWNTGGYTTIDEGFGAGRGSGSGPNDADYMEEDIGGGGVWDGTVSTLSAPVAGTHTLKMRGAKNSGSGETGHATLQLYQGNPGSGGTLIATLTGTTYADATFTTDTYNLTAGEVSSITNYATLYFRLTEVKDGGGAGRTIQISAVEYEIPEAPTPKAGTDSGSGTDASSVVYSIPGTDSGGVAPGSGSTTKACNNGINKATPLGTLWTTPENVDSSDNNVAYVFLDPQGQSRYLYASQGTGPDVPTGATVTGVEVTAETDRWDQSYLVFSAFLTKDGTNASPDALNFNFSGTSNYTQTIGSPTAMWGYTEITPAEANSSSFGLFLYVLNDDTVDPYQLDLDVVSWTFHYTAAGSAESAVTALGGGDASKAGTDSGSGVDSTSLAVAIATTDSASGVDSSTFTAAYGVTDTGVGSETGLVNVPISGTESGSHADASVLLAQFWLIEAGTGTDASTLAAAFTSTDANTLVTDSGSVTVPAAGTDSGSGTEASTLVVSATAVETGSGADVSALVASVTATTDSGAGSDASALAASITATSDSSTLVTESGTVSVPVSVVESGTGSEVSSLVVSVAVTDTGSGVDASATVALAVTDTGAGTETGAVAVPISASDTGTGVEVSALAAAIPVTDSGAGTDTGTVGIASLTATDSGVLSGEVAVTSSGFIPKSGTDSGAGTDVSALLQLQDLFPDADIATTGWTVTPLFSKVNDSSDATVIQATAV